jgi:hypothetical protein
MHTRTQADAVLNIVAFALHTLLVGAAARCALSATVEWMLCIAKVFHLFPSLSFHVHLVEAIYVKLLLRWVVCRCGCWPQRLIEISLSVWLSAHKVSPAF